MQEIFQYLDKNKDGLIDYREFCHLAEEKYKNIDPFDEDLANQTKEHFTKTSYVKGISFLDR